MNNVIQLCTSTIKNVRDLPSANKVPAARGGNSQALIFAVENGPH